MSKPLRLEIMERIQEIQNSLSEVSGQLVQASTPPGAIRHDGWCWHVFDGTDWIPLVDETEQERPKSGNDLSGAIRNALG